MFDIDRYLSDINLVEMELSDDALTRTKKRCEEEQRKQREQQERMKKVKKGSLIAVPAAAVLLIGVIIGALLFTSAANIPQAVAYYTVDVNPSICVHVDGESNVTGVVGQNGDAQSIVKSLDCIGKPVADAIDDILGAAKDEGYFGDGHKTVLIGCFTADGTRVKGTLTDLQSRLELSFGDMIDLLIVSGTLEDMQAADELEVSAGLLKLAQMAEGVEVKDGDKVEEVAGEVEKVNEQSYCAPELSASVSEAGITLSWDALDFDAMDYAGKVRYAIAAGATKEEVTSFSAPILKTVSFYTFEEPETSFTIKLKPGVTKYFVIYAQYGDIVKCGNVVECTMPESEPAPSPSATDTPEPTKTNEPDPNETPTPPHTVKGKVSGEKVVLSWSKETAENFEGYKVVASKTNPNPKYPDDGYIKYITDRSKTSVSLYEGTGGLKANTYYYFSITYLFSDGSSVAGNAVKLKVPPKSADPTPKPTKEPSKDYAASTISGSIDGTTVKLSWNMVEDSRFEGYKVVASLTNPNPKYPDDGYLYYITDACTTCKNFSVSKLGKYEPGAKCYFSITVVYNDAKKAGNSIALNLPDPPAEEPYPSTKISGSIDGTTVKLSWNKVEDSRFEGYKVVASLTNPNPKYPDDGYLYYITDACTTCKNFNVSKLGKYEPGAKCWFSITVVYDDTKKAGNSIALNLPDPPAEEPYPSTNISGSIDGTAVRLSWGKISDERLEGYKVMYSFSDSSPVYGESGRHYAEWITDCCRTSCSVNITELEGYSSGATCWFSITALYEDHSVKRPGNVWSTSYTEPEG